MIDTTASHLLEREAELGELRSLLDDAEAGHGRLLVIEGPAGTGKSALVAAAGELAERRGLRVLAAAGSEGERGFAFGAIRQLFEGLLAGASDAERSRLLAGAAAPAAWAIEAADGESGRAEAGFAAVHGIYWLTANVASAGTLLLLVDDLHWVDEASVRALDHLARRVTDIPVAAVFTLRPAEPGAPSALLHELRAQPGVRSIAPRALSAAGVSGVVRREVPGADAELCASFHEASGGNPLYLRELLRTLASNGPISPAAVRQAAIPSLGERLVRRIAHIGPQAPALATAMAVLGNGERLALAAALAGLEEATAARIAQRLVRIEVLAGEDPFALVHPLVRRSLYDTLSVTERDTAHARAAELLREGGAPPERRAAHLGALRPSGSASVAAALLQVARDALGRAAPDAAIRALRRALEEEADEPSEAALLFELGKAEMLVRNPACVGHLQEAHRLEEAPKRRAAIAVVLTELLVAAGQWEAGSAFSEQALQELGDREPALRTEILTLRAATCAYDPRLVDRFDGDLPGLEQLAAGEGRPARTLTALLASVTGLRAQSLGDVVPLVERALDGGRFVEDRSGGAWATAQAMGGLLCVDEYDRVDALATAIEDEGRRTGSAYALISGPAFRGWTACRRGDLIAAESELRTALDLIFESGMSLWIANVFHAFIEVLLERPSVADVAALVEGVELEPAFLATFSGGLLLEARGRLRLASQDLPGALEDLRAVAAIYGPLRFAPTLSPWRSVLALLLPPAERPWAKALVEEEQGLAEVARLPRPRGIALRAAGLLEGGEAGLGLLRSSVEVLEGSPSRLELAVSQLELGASLRRLNRRTEAREQLAVAMDLAHRCGAERLVGRAGEELRAAGARPRRPARTGVDALTASERRVAHLASQGRSNLEIAQALYVSVKTVDTHLSHAYGKLGLSGQGARRGLADALGPPR